MNKKSILIILAALVLLMASLVWAPWISGEEAETQVAQAFASAWQEVIDGCGFNCDGCGIKETHRVVIGYSVEIEYACGMLPSDSSEFHQHDVVYVSPLGTVHGLEKP